MSDLDLEELAALVTDGQAHGWVIGNHVRRPFVALVAAATELIRRARERDAAGMALDIMTARALRLEQALDDAKNELQRRRAPVFTASPPVGECVNPYTCRLLKRIDAEIARARGKTVGWSKDGTLCEIMPKGHGVELRSIFPGRLYSIAADVQNRWRWTRKVLSR